MSGASEWEPRSGSLTLGGHRWLARMIDKARADAAGTIGDYSYPCPMDQSLLETLAISAAEFQKLALKAGSDDEVVAALEKRAKRKK